MDDVKAIIIRIVIFLAIVQLSQTAPQNARNIAASQGMKNSLPYSHLKEEEEEKRNDGPFHSIEKRHSQVFDAPPKFLKSCDQIYNLDIGDSAVFFSDDGVDRRRCRFRFKSPAGTRIDIECPIFNLNKAGCKLESFTINERGRKKKNFCKRNRPPLGYGKSNRITVAYRRNKDMESKQNRGYICRASVITQDPTTTTTATTTTTTTTTTSSLAPSTYLSWITVPTTTPLSSTTQTPSTISTVPTIIPILPIFTTPPSDGNSSSPSTILPILPITLLPLHGGK